MKKILNILKKNIIIIALVIVMGIIVGGRFYNKKLTEELKKMEDEIKNKYSEMKKYQIEKEKAPSPELIGKLTKKKNFLEEQFKIMLNSFSTVYPSPPQFTKYPSIEFKEYIYYFEDKLSKTAKARNVSIPTSLGFPKQGLIDVNQIPIWLLRFEIVKDLLRLIIDSGITMVTNLAPGEPQGFQFYEVVPVKLSITGTSNEIVRCIKYFDNPSSYFTIENVSIRNIGENLFRADIDLNAIIFKKSEKQG